MNGVVFQISETMIAKMACGKSPNQFVSSAMNGSQPNQPFTKPLLRRERELPGERGDDGDDPVGDQDRGPHHSTGEDDLVHHHREREADDQLDGHRDDHDHAR